MAMNVTFLCTVTNINSLQPVLLTDCFKHRMKMNLGLKAQVFTVIWKPMLTSKMAYVEKSILYNLFY
jgi:hypothetical protein